MGTLSLALFTWLVARQAKEQITLQTREVKAVEDQTKALGQQADALRSQADATARQVEISSASLEATSRPVLVALVERPARREVSGPLNLDHLEPITFWNDHLANVVPERVFYEETDEMVYCSIPLRNVGAGVAFIQGVHLLTRTEYPGRVSRVVVPANETTRANFAVTLRDRGSDRVTDAILVTRQGGRAQAQFTVRLVYTGASRDLVTITEITASELPSGTFIYTQQRVWDGERDESRLLVSTENIE